MILKNKKALILSSLLILLPIPVGFLLREQFPAGYVDGLGYILWVPSLSLLAGQWLCIALTAIDPGNKNRNRKPLTVVLWIMPLMSNLTCGILYALLLGVEFSPVSWMTAAFGVLFAVIGNYMPKTKMNSTMGIKVPWSYSSEENWNATHRFAGKVWVIGGLLMLFGVALPEGAAVALMFVAIVALCALPLWYSWRFYKREKAEGRVEKAGYSAVDKKILKGSMVFLAVLLVFVAAVLFTGDLEYEFGQDVLAVKADWYSDLTLKYDAIDSVEYCDGRIPGLRVGGFGSFRLLMGFFKNDEFGTYTRYTYYKPESCVVLTVGSRTIVLSGKDAEETRRIYDTLLEKSS